MAEKASSRSCHAKRVLPKTVKCFQMLDPLAQAVKAIESPHCLQRGWNGVKGMQKGTFRPGPGRGGGASDRGARQKQQGPQAHGRRRRGAVLAGDGLGKDHLAIHSRAAALCCARERLPWKKPRLCGFLAPKRLWVCRDMEYQLKDEASNHPLNLVCSVVD